MSRTTSQGLVIVTSGSLAELLTKGVPVGDTVDAALARLHTARVEAEAARDRAEAAATQATITVAAAADDLDVDEAIADVVERAAGVPRVEAAVQQLSVNVQSALFGAIGDGVADDRDAIQSAVDTAATFGLSVFLPPGRYRLTGSVSLPNDVRVWGTQGSVVDLSALGSNPGFLALGTAAPQILLATDAVEGGKTVKVGSAAGLAPGDWIKIGAASPATSVTNQPIGEIVRIRSIADNVLTFVEPLSRSYLTTASASVQKLTQRRNISIDGLCFQGAETATTTNFVAIKLDTAYNVRVTDCTFKWVHNISVWLTDTLFAKVSGCHFEDALAAGTSYGVACHWATQDVTITGCTSVRVRHQVTCGGGTSRRGTPRRVTVSACSATESGDAAYDAHSGCDNFTVTGCHVIGGGQDGIIAQGRYVSITGNVVTGVARYGIFLQGTSIGGLSGAVSGNVVTRTGSRAIFVQPDTVASHRSWGGVAVSGNNVTDAGTSGIEIAQSATTFWAEGFSVTGNTVRRSGNNGIYIRGCQDIAISGNHVHQPAAGYSGIRVLNSPDVCVVSNSINGSGTATYGVLIDGPSADAVCSTNRIRACGTGVRQDAAAGSGVFIGNNTRTCNTGYNLAGVGNVAANNL